MLEARNAAGNTPLHWAAVNGRMEAVKLLVRAGADVSVRNGVGRDAVGEAEVGGWVEVVEWLLCGEGRGVDGKGEEEGVGEEEEEGVEVGVEAEDGTGKGGEEEQEGVRMGEGTGEVG